MRKELDEALVKDFPLLFADRHASKHQSCMAFGFDVGDGWEPLIRMAAERLEPIIQKYVSENPNPECVKCGEPKINHSVLDTEYSPDFPRAAQVKEKFGVLCLYMTSYTGNMNAIVRTAEKLSTGICEKCGAKGELRQKGWWKTLCDACNEKKYEGI